MIKPAIAKNTIKTHIMNNNKTAVKPAYEKMTFSVTEVETQGVLCSSAAPQDPITGGLSNYTGSSL